MSEPIRLKRDQLAKVFFDHETLRQMELLLDTVDQISNTTLLLLRTDLDNHTGDASIHFTVSSIDHGSIAGLADDDHTQYHNDARALTWLNTRTTSDLPEGSNLYYTEARVNSNRKNNILEYGYEAVTVSTTVTKTITVFTGSTASQTITLPTTGVAGRKVEIMNNGTVKILISGSSVLGELYPNESAEFVDISTDWLA